MYGELKDCDALGIKYLGRRWVSAHSYRKKGYNPTLIYIYAPDHERPNFNQDMRQNHVTALFLDEGDSTNHESETVEDHEIDNVCVSILCSWRRSWVSSGIEKTIAKQTKIRYRWPSEKVKGCKFKLTPQKRVRKLLRNLFGVSISSPRLDTTADKVCSRIVQGALILHQQKSWEPLKPFGLSLEHTSSLLIWQRTNRVDQPWEH